jgi:hypothetical protein
MIRFKTISLRQGQWFKVLAFQERGLLDVTVRWVNTVKSERLKRILTGILSKLAAAMASPLTVSRGRGRRIALHLSELAVSLGNDSTWIWRFDNNFQASLGVGVAGPQVLRMSGQSSSPIFEVK